jgi:site-specific DNA-methyltransferase (adenine-specific)
MQALFLKSFSLLLFSVYAYNVSNNFKEAVIKPYYQDEHYGITIYHGDCREILPTLEPVDLVLTDPPYGMNFVSNHRVIKHSSIVGDNFLPIDLIQMAINKANNAAYVFCRWDNLSDMPQPKSVLAWVKNNWSMGDLLHEHGRQWEAICFYANSGHSFIKRIPDVLYAKRTGNIEHPTQKPESVIGQLIESNYGNTILDPFMGSGTTLVAAKQLNRKAIGIEIEEKYCEIAVKRLQQSVFEF